EHGGGSPVGIVIITSNDCACAAEHFPDRAEMVAGIIVRLVSVQLSLRIHSQRDGVCCIAILAFVVPAPDELPGRIDRAAGLLHDFDYPVQAVVSELTRSLPLALAFALPVYVARFPSGSIHSAL